MQSCSRRRFLQQAIGLGAFVLGAAPGGASLLFGADKSGAK